jgi:pyridoxamine 5'-phosphate oxidase
MANPTAPWKPLLSQHISTLNQPPTFTLATTTRHPPHHPRLRTLIFRGFFAELPPNQHNLAERNPAVYESDMLSFTTDVRMRKVEEVGGGGGDVECCFWMEKVQVQWRVRGRCWVLGGGEGEEEVRRHLYPLSGASGEWSFEREVGAQFGNLSESLRRSFAGPVPGSERVPGDSGVVEDWDEEVARRNFRVGVVVVEWVEMLDLVGWKRVWWEREGEGWKTGEVWP